MGFEARFVQGSKDQTSTTQSAKNSRSLVEAGKSVVKKDGHFVLPLFLAGLETYHIQAL